MKLTIYEIVPDNGFLSSLSKALNSFMTKFCSELAICELDSMMVPLLSPVYELVIGDGPTFVLVQDSD
jgi:hypothetical protein